MVHPMARTPLLRNLVDRAVDGGLAPYLQQHRDAGLSYGAIARDMAATHDIDVTAETIRVWCHDMEIAGRPVLTDDFGVS